jgi:endo-1,4-beta-xylanase
MKPIIPFFLFLLLFSAVYAQQNEQLKESLQNLKPQDVFPENPEKVFLFNDGNSKTQPSTINFKLDAQQGLVFEVEVLKALSSHYGVQASWVASKAIKKGDVLLARFAMRSVYAKQETGDAEVNFYVQDSQNYEKSVILPLGVNPEWKIFNIPFIAHADMPIGKAAICFSFGALAQKVEISNIEILNFKDRITKNELPETKFTYRGREENAAWRNEALKRIDEIRKAPLKIQVVDAKGKPLAGATVKVKLLKSAFLFGTELNPGLINQETVDAIKYKEKVKQLFNAVTIGNGLKWGPWIDAERQMDTKNAIKWIEANHLNLRGHNLVWPGSKFTPSKFKTKNGFVEGLEDSIINHIKDIANYTKGKVIAWDVVNEMLHEQDYFKVMPRSEVAKWYKLTKQIDPNAQLFLNEYGMLNSISSPKTIETFIQLIDELKSYGAPIDALGVQGHVGRQPRDPALVISDLDLLAKTGMPIQITEFDINMPDEELQADYTRDFLIACYSHPAVTGFTMWGFWQASHWKPDGAMFRKDWTAKPNAKVWEDLVTKQWTTNFTIKSDQKGMIDQVGFLGTYEITISDKNNASKTIIYELDKSSKPVKIAF